MINEELACRSYRDTRFSHLHLHTHTQIHARDTSTCVHNQTTDVDSTKRKALPSYTRRSSPRNRSQFISRDNVTKFILRLNLNSRLRYEHFYSPVSLLSICITEIARCRYRSHTNFIAGMILVVMREQ